MKNGRTWVYLTCHARSANNKSKCATTGRRVGPRPPPQRFAEVVTLVAGRHELAQPATGQRLVPIITTRT